MTVKADRRARVAIFATHPPLPRGPHLLTREQVADSQRTRLMAAFTELMAERGYAAVRLAELVTRAGVSKATFYEHFADKEECMLAACEHFFRTIIEAIAPFVAEDAPTLNAFLCSVITRYIEVIEGDLTAARAFLVELDAAGPKARACRHNERQAFIALFSQRHEQYRAGDPSLAPLPMISYEALVDASRELVRDRLDSAAEPNLTELIPDLTLTFTAMFKGAAAAQDAEPKPVSGRPPSPHRRRSRASRT
jgi:AcrR family transcriptional regulator